MYFKLILTVISIVILTACGGSDDNNTTGNNSGGSNNTPSNVALATNGSTISSSFAGNETFLTDGDTTTTSSWSPGAQDDFITIEFDAEYSISEITLYTNATNNNDTQLQTSTDGVNFDDLNYLGGCFSLSLGSGRIACGISPDIQVRYIRVVVNTTVTTNTVTDVELYELEATGI